MLTRRTTFPHLQGISRLPLPCIRTTGRIHYRNNSPDQKNEYDDRGAYYLRYCETSYDSSIFTAEKHALTMRQGL